MIFCWDYDAGGNVEHVNDHGLTPDDVEYAFETVIEDLRSRSTNRPALKGLTPDGRLIFVTYEVDIEDGDTFVAVVTAYEIGDQ